MSRFEKTRESHSESRSDSIIFILLRHQVRERGSVNEATTPGQDALKKRTRVQDDFVAAASRRACLNAFFLQIKLAGKTASLIFRQSMRKPVTFPLLASPISAHKAAIA
jgi:hypothetical protein